MAVHGEVRLGVRLLGAVDVTMDGVPVVIRSSAAASLLALLVLRRGPRSREQIAADLWPDSGPASAPWLRQALWQLKRAFGAAADAVIGADGESIGLRPTVRLDLDVDAFEQALHARPPSPERAVALYRGDLLDGNPLECFTRDRERLADRYEDALAAVGVRCLAAGDMQCVRDVSMHLIDRDPLREEGHALLIELYGLEGSRSQVSRQYRRLRGLLARELGVEPLPETEHSYRAALERTRDRSALRVSGEVQERPQA